MAEGYVWAKRVQPGALQLRRLENIRGKDIVVQLMAIQEWEASQIAEDLIWRRENMLGIRLPDNAELSLCQQNELRVLTAWGRDNKEVLRRVSDLTSLRFS